MPKPKKLMRSYRRQDACEEITESLRSLRSHSGKRFRKEMGKAARACRLGNHDLMVMYLLQAGAFRAFDLKRGVSPFI